MVVEPRPQHPSRHVEESSKIRVVLHHGFGTNGRDMSMILGAPLLKAGYEAVAIDMPNYGMTKVGHGTTVSYDWVNIADDFINSGLERDPRPIVLYGVECSPTTLRHSTKK
jgi:pimeloyl-ACP methyl ester carboxylesterase